MSAIPDRIRAEYVFDHGCHMVHVWQREPEKGKDRRITVLFFRSEAYARGVAVTIAEIPDQIEDFPLPGDHP